MNKKIVFAILFVAILGVGLAGGELISGGGLDTNTPLAVKQVDLSLGQATKDILANLATETKTICDSYPPIECAVTDEKTGECLEWVQPKQCLDFDAKLGICNKWDYELTCQDINAPIGISSPTITPKSCTTTECCYDIIDEPYYHRYNTCLPNTGNKTENEAKVLEYVKEDLTKIAEQSAVEKSKQTEPLIDTLEVNIK